MTLAEIKDQLDQIFQTWRDGTTDEQRAELALLDNALADLDEIDVGTAAAFEAVDELRGRIEVLMDEIEICLGMEPLPIEEINELKVQLVSEEEEPLIDLDNPKPESWSTR